MVLLMSGFAYFILSRALSAHHGESSTFASALGSDAKGKLSLVLYATAIPTAFVEPLLACAVYVVVALMWLIPDRRFERAVNDTQQPSA